jgi:hypothetical protein
VIDSGDPKDTWTDTEVWLRRQIAIVTMANRDLLTERTEQLAQDVADHFELPEGSKLQLPLTGQADLDSVVLAPASTLAMPGGKLAPLLVAARSSYYLPMMLGTVAAGLLGGGPVIHLAMAGFSLVLGTGIGKKIIGLFEKGEFDVCTLFYSEFKSVISQVPTALQLIPAAVPAGAEQADAGTAGAVYEYEPSEEAILETLLPRNIAIQILAALYENQAGFFGAQMGAMDSATRNAGDMIADLTLKFNRQRQAQITKELIEIISGTEAL